MKKLNKDNPLQGICKMYWTWLANSELTCSTHTIRSYETSISCYFSYLQDKGGQTISDFSAEKAFSREMIERWMSDLAGKGLSAETCNLRIANIRTFLKYLADKDFKYMHFYLDAKKIKPLRCIKKKQSAIPEETLKLIMMTPDGKTKSGAIDIMIMSFLYGTAVRIGELRSLQIADIHLLDKGSYAHIVGKGNKERMVYIPEKVVANLRTYIKIFHGAYPDPASFLFYSRVKGEAHPISAAAIDKRLKKIAQKVNQAHPEIKCELHAHAFRRTRATDLSDEGMNPFQISKILGHQHLTTTMKYVDVSMLKKERDLMSIEDEKDRAIEPLWKSKAKDMKTLFRSKK